MNCSTYTIIFHTYLSSVNIKLTRTKNISKIKLKVSRLPFSPVPKSLIINKSGI